MYFLLESMMMYLLFKIKHDLLKKQKFNRNKKLLKLYTHINTFTRSLLCLCMLNGCLKRSCLNKIIKYFVRLFVILIRKCWIEKLEHKKLFVIQYINSLYK